jgi:hypothetical protein
MNIEDDDIDDVEVAGLLNERFVCTYSDFGIGDWRVGNFCGERLK